MRFRRAMDHRDSGAGGSLEPLPRLALRRHPPDGSARFAFPTASSGAGGAARITGRIPVPSFPVLSAKKAAPARAEPLPTRPTAVRCALETSLRPAAGPAAPPAGRPGRPPAGPAPPASSASPNPADRTKLLLRLAPGEDRRKKPEGAEGRESAAHVHFPVRTAAGSRRSRPTGGAAIPGSLMARNCLPGATAPDSCRVLENHRFEGPGLYGGARFRSDQEDGGSVRGRDERLSRNRLRREAVEEHWTSRPGPRGSPADECLARRDADPPIATTTKPIKAFGEQFLAEPDGIRGQFRGRR